MAFGRRGSQTQASKVRRFGAWAGLSVILLGLVGCPSTRDRAVYNYQHGLFYQAYRGFDKMAIKGDPVSLYAAGYMRYYGIGIARDKDKAREYIRVAAKKGYPQAVTALKMIIEDHPTMRVDVGGLRKPIKYPVDRLYTPDYHHVSWMRERKPQNYTIVLKEDPYAKALVKSLVQTYHMDVARYRFFQGRKPVTRVTAGDFKSFEAAQQKLAALGTALKSKAEIRSWAEIQSVMLPD